MWFGNKTIFYSSFFCKIKYNFIASKSLDTSYKLAPAGATDSYGATTEIPFSIEVINTNDAPTVTNKLEDQLAYENNLWIFQFAETTFTDVDLGDQLTYSAKITGESALPSWIYFDTETRTFTANPITENIGSYNIDVTATDMLGASAITSFVLTVLNVNGLEEVNSTDYYVYPNPSSGLINIYSEQGFYETKITVSDITGKKILETNTNNMKM